jgi:hypothetical protein
LAVALPAFGFFPDHRHDCPIDLHVQDRDRLPPLQ